MEGHHVLPTVSEAFKLGYREQDSGPCITQATNTPTGHQGLTHGRKIPMAAWHGASCDAPAGGPSPLSGPTPRQPLALEDSSRELEELRYGSD